MNKLCISCLVEKDIVEFELHSVYNGKEIYRNKCKVCRAIQCKSWHQQDRLNKPEHYLFLETRKRANSEGIKFDLEESDIQIPDVCPILQIKLQQHIDFARDDSPSIDRLIPSKGYVKGNCFIISYKANRMKQDNTLEDLEKIVKYIKERV